MDRSPFPRIGDYGFLSDCHTSALVAPDGAVEWLCLPRFDSASVFTAMLDRDAGSFRFGPVGLEAPLARRYIPGTKILETTWMTETGWVTVRDALTVAEWREEGDHPHARPPASHETEQTLLRSAECIQGEVDLEIVCDLLFDYGESVPQWSLEGDGPWTATAPHSDLTVRLVSDTELTIEGDTVSAQPSLKSGQGCFCALAWGDPADDPVDRDEINQRLVVTSDFWRSWLADGRFPDHPWRVHLQRSALALKGLTYAPTGALLAAATTSLPETPGGERNWDYRYTWIRDATFTLWAMHTLGFDLEARDFVEFVRDI